MAIARWYVSGCSVSPSDARNVGNNPRRPIEYDATVEGLGSDSICFCANCDRKFRAKTGKALPRSADWDDAVYRDWIMWSYARRIEVWELNNRTTRETGGPECIWAGMNSGSVTSQARSIRDLREICGRADIMMLDHQRRDDDTGFQQNGDTGKRVHSLLGWDKVAPESMAMYQSGPGYYRIASKPVAEARMWMIAGIAGGIQPWWHHAGAYHEDRRMYRTADPVTRWWKKNEQYLVNWKPVASVGVVWSQRNTDFFGRDDAADRVDAPYTGFMHALVRARIPYLPIHADDIEQNSAELKLLILPNVGALSDAQATSIRRFVEKGGSLVATERTSLYNEWGDPRPDFALGDLFACHTVGETPPLRRASDQRRSGPSSGASAPAPSGHTYLRLSSELRGRVDGPKAGDEPAPAGERHAVLSGFEETDILPFGGTLSRLKVDATATVPLTFVPAFPTYPPETAGMRQPRTDIPGLVLSQHGTARVAYLPADIDRRYARQHLPDHAALLSNVVRWAAGESIPVSVEGPLMAAAGLATRSPGEDAGTEAEVLEAVQVALDLGADINAVDKNGETAVHAAAYKNLPNVVKLLASKGAKIELWNRPNKFGWTPLAIAAGYRFGNFKPSPDTEAAVRQVMLAAGVTPPKKIVAMTQQVY